MESTLATSSSPIDTRRAIAQLRRDLVLGMVLKFVLGMVLVGAIAYGNDTLRMSAFFAMGVCWVAMAVGNRRGTALAAGSSSLIAAGLYEAAETQLSQSLKGVGFFRATKLLSLHHLALLRHAQGRWAESAELSNALLNHRLGPLKGLAKSARLMLASGLLHTGDLPGTYGAILQIYTQRLSLAEALQLLRVQVEYEAQIGAWQSMVRGMPVKVQLAELMGSADAAAVQGFLALASRHTQQPEWEQWLCRRVELLTDVQALTERSPLLRQLWA
jgi:hypothetical protein